MNYIKLPLLAALGFMATVCQAEDSSASAHYLNGEWRVISVRLDNLASTLTGITVNDPHYVGRKVIFNNGSVSGNLDETVNCNSAQFNVQQAVSLDKLLTLTSGTRHTEPQNPKADDYGFKAQNLSPVLITCKEGKFGPKGESIGNWVALDQDNMLITNWYDNSYLVMKRIDKAEKIAPSFNCKAALNRTEKAICNNNELASWDNSVNQAYKTLILQQQKVMPDDKDILNEIKVGQSTWLKKRNQCQDDTACLEKSMKERVDAITQQYM